MRIQDSIKFISGVGENLATKYAKLGIFTVEDLIYHFPRRYEDYSVIGKIATVQPGPVTFKVKVNSVSSRYVRRGLHITEALVSDTSGAIKLTWFNQPYRSKSLQKGKPYYVSGEYAFQRDRYSIVNPAMELASSFPKNTARIVPIYPETKGLKSHQIRKHIASVIDVIDQLPEPLPAYVVNDLELIGHAKALHELHYPTSSSSLEDAKNRLGFEEIFEISLAGALNKHAIRKKQGPAIDIDRQMAKSYADSLDFKLTDAQRKSAWQILKDLATHQPMNRMLEGDVGSGKSVVAGMATLMTIKAGYQVAYMAPTEILARQQYEDLGKQLSKFKVKTELLIGSMKTKDKQKVYQRLENQEVQFVVGTHALIQDDPIFASLGLVIVDEQHRFGVKQREKLMGKAKFLPHVLTMTATPIPRSLALTLYGELDLSVIDELPPGRKQVQTKIVSPSRRNDIYAQIEEQLKLGRQGYVICPLIDESDKLGVKSVKEEFERLNTGPFKNRTIAMLHGKLRAEEKEGVMGDFAAGKIDLLVATTVVEVGVNVPNATVMLIEGAERFGLAQLHQLRGRIRRSTFQAYCFVMPTTAAPPSKRLRALESTNDGFKLAELDLRLRGPGQIYGLAQSGVLDLRLAKLSDTKLIQSAKLAAEKTVERDSKLIQYPRLKTRVEKLRKITKLN